MSFWETNSAILANQYPLLLEEVNKVTEQPQGEASLDITVETSATGLPTIKVGGLYVHSPRNPQREGLRLAESVKTVGDETDPVIVLGFGLGYAAQAAAELWPTRPIIIVEKNPGLLRLAMEQRDLRTLLERINVVFVLGGSGESITGALSLFESTDEKKSTPPVIRNRTLCDLDEEWYKNVESRIRTWNMRDDVNMATLKRFGRRWIRNLSHNMSFIRDLPGISRLAGLAADIPVFLAAAGPGLEQTASLLGEIQKRCIVVAVDTSIRFLLKHGIKPDFALVVDPQFWNSRHLDRCDLDTTRLVAESAVYPPVLHLPFKGRYLCGSLFPLGSYIEKRVDPKGQLGAGGSVATTAWDFARSLGATEIWIAGLDLAFPGLKTHFRGARFEENALAESKRLSPAETWLVRALRDGLPFLAPSASGGQVATDRRLSLYAAWFENRFRQYPNVRNYSLSSGGLAIAGLTHGETEKLLALPPRRAEIDTKLEAVFSKIDADFFEPEETRRRGAAYANAVSTLLRGLNQIKSAAEKGAAIAEKALKRPVPAAEQGKILAELDKITLNIAESEVKEVAGFLFPPQESHENDSNDPKTGEKGGKNTQNGTDPFRTYLESSLKLYESLAEAAGINVKEMNRFVR